MDTGESRFRVALAGCAFGCGTATERPIGATLEPGGEKDNMQWSKTEVIRYILIYAFSLLGFTNLIA